MLPAAVAQGAGVASRARCVICRCFLGGDTGPGLVALAAIGAIPAGYAHTDCAELVDDIYFSA